MFCTSQIPRSTPLKPIQPPPSPKTNTNISTGVFNAAIFPCVWLFFPEPKGRSLEELDVIFASAHAKKENPVKTAKHTPRLHGRELEQELARYFDTDALQGTPNA